MAQQPWSGWVAGGRRAAVKVGCCTLEIGKRTLDLTDTNRNRPPVVRKTGFLNPCRSLCKRIGSHIYPRP